METFTYLTPTVGHWTQQMLLNMNIKNTAYITYLLDWYCPSVEQYRRPFRLSELSFENVCAIRAAKAKQFRYHSMSIAGTLAELQWRRSIDPKTLRVAGMFDWDDAARMVSDCDLIVDLQWFFWFSIIYVYFVYSVVFYRDYYKSHRWYTAADLIVKCSQSHHQH